MNLTVASVCLSLLLATPQRSAQTTATAENSTESLRKFVQAFYDWYVPALRTGYHDARWKVIQEGRASDFSSELLAALAEDAESNSFVAVDWDPFLNDDGYAPADDGDRYVVTQVTHKGSVYSAEVARRHGTNAERRILVDVECKSGSCIFLNFRDPRDPHYDLMRCLKLLQQERQDAKKAGREARLHVDEKLKESELAVIDDQTVRGLVLRSDLGRFWTRTDTADIFGFIGDNYQRFEIHYSRVAKSVARNDEYELRGKTRYRGRTSDFTGTARIARVATARPPNPVPPPEVHDMVVYPPDDIRGVIVWRVSMKQDPLSPSSSTIEGALTSGFYLDFRKRVRLDDRMMDADGYSNNEFVGVWRSHDRKQALKCHWGDFRIPDSGDLDQGAGAFCPDERYVPNGWQEYVKAAQVGGWDRYSDRWWEPRQTPSPGATVIKRR